MNFKFSTQKIKTHIIKTIFLGFLIFLFQNNLSAQCKPMIKIDGDPTVVNTNDDFGLTLPYWLKEGQTLAIGSSVSKISVIEFNVVNGSTLEFSRVVNVTSTAGITVPPETVWKIESIAKLNNSSTYRSATFEAGTYVWKVPGCAEEICIDMWGAGGGGGGRPSGSSIYGGGGGGGGGYGSQCFSVKPGDSYTVTVGIGGIGILGAAGTSGGVTNVNGPNIDMTVNGGNGGNVGTTSVGGVGGNGGTSNAFSNAQGAKGNNGCNVYSLLCGAGGTGANGGNGGVGILTNTDGLPGAKPGGGGSGASNLIGSAAWAGGSGADGKVIISW